MFHHIDANSADEAWTGAARWFLLGGSATAHSGRGGDTLEVLRASLTIHNPRFRWISSRAPALNPAFSIAEVIWIVQGRKDAKFLTYFNRKLPEFQGDGSIFSGAYGHRLRCHFGFDQLHRAFSALSANPSSRQIALQIWDPRTDFPDANGIPTSPDIPCNIVAFLKLRNQKLEWTQIMRSNDIFRGLPHNIVQFTCLQEVLAGWLGVEIGSYCHFSDSLHLYSTDGKIEQRICKPITELNSDSLALPYEQSIHVFRLISDFTDLVIQETIPAGEILRLFRGLCLPQAFTNFASILAAEGLRRRCAVDAVDKVLSACSNPCLRALFDRWMLRTLKKTA